MTKFSNIFLLIFFSLLLFITLIMLINSFNISSMIILLMIYSLLIFIILSFSSKNYMYLIIPYLISGLLIIFLYFTGLISNMKNNFYIKPMLMLTFLMNTILLFIMIITTCPTFLTNNKFHLIFSNSNISNMNFMINTNKKMFENIFNIYLYPYNNFTILCMLFVLMAMFMIIKICSIKSSSLRKIN